MNGRVKLENLALKKESSNLMKKLQNHLLN